MMCILVLGILSAQPPAPALDGEQLMKVLEGLHSEIRDFEFIYEGENTVSEAFADKLRKLGNWGIQRTFQGNYAYRSADGAAYLDLYERPFGDDGAFFRRTIAQLKGKLSETTRDEYQRDDPAPVLQRSGAPGAFMFPCSPEWFLWLPRWRRLGYSVGSAKYQGEGWDSIDGTPVMRFSVDYYPDVPRAERSVTRIWIDLNRGGYVLREEFTRGSELWWRLDNVRLARFPLERERREVWFPVGADLHTFTFDIGKIEKTAVFRQTYRLVRGTLVLNRGLKDERFSLDWKGPRSKDAILEKFVADIKPKRVPQDVSQRNDPASIRAYQERKLAEADRQAAQLDASPPARRGWDWTAITQGLLAISGMAILAGALILRRRQS